jgi:hypothetical protein
MADFSSLKSSFFFDSAKVLNTVAAGTRKVLSKLGAFIRRRAKSSIRKSKQSALAGQPPKSHAGQLRDLIFFAWDAARQSVVIGPIAFKSQAVVPELMEEGGTVTVSVLQSPTGRKARSQEQAEAYRALILAGKIVPAQAIKVKVTKKYAPHPFMGPARDAELPSFAGQLRGLTRG